MNEKEFVQQYLINNGTTGQAKREIEWAGLVYKEIEDKYESHD